MKYEVHVNNLHSFTLAVTGQDPDTFRPQNVVIDLSSAALFTGAQGSEGQQLAPSRSFLPFESNIRNAFALLSGVTSRSPVVESLLQFRDAELDSMLQGLKSVPPPLINETVLALPTNREKVAKALQETIARIDRELPNFFEAEKQLGTFTWLQQGGKDTKLGFSAARERPVGSEIEIPNDTGILLDQSGRRVLWDTSSRAAFVLSGEHPSATTVFSALCNSGSLGTEMLELNKGAAVRHVASQFTQNVDQELKSFGHLRERLAAPIPSAFFTTLKASALGVAGVALMGVPVMVNLLNESLSFLDGVRAMGALYFADSCARAIKGALYLRGIRLAQKAGMPEGKLVTMPGVAAINNTYTTALLDHTVSRSAGNAVVLVGPRSSEEWQALLPQTVFLDLSSVPSSEVVAEGERIRVVDPSIFSENSIAVTKSDDESEHTLADPGEIQRNADRILTIERGAQTWDTLHAAAILGEFCQRRCISIPRPLRPKLQETLSTAAGSFTDASGHYPEALRPFVDLTKHLEINNRTWALLARALNSACVLMRLQDSRRAQVIAQEVFAKHFPGNEATETTA